MNTKELKRAAAHAADTGQDLWNDGVARAADVLAEAQKKAAAILDEAGRRAVPAAKEAGVRAADFASRHLDAWEPHIKDALEKVSPAVEAATDMVTDELLPRLQTMLHDAAAHPAVVEVAEALPEPARKKGGKLRTFGKVVAIGAVVAGVLAAVRHFLTPKDDGWTAHEPSKAYVNNTDGFAAAPQPAPAEPAASAPEPAEEATGSAEEAPGDETASAEPAAGYGEGAYVGENPPEGFAIKGNERSKKYHLAGTGGYERTIPDVWFASEEAAQAAGFTKAQR